MKDVWKPDYERPIRSRYVDPVDLIWFSTARRLGLTVRRNAAIFSATDGTGLMELGPRSTLDPDDCAAQMIFHEICHWIINGAATFTDRDWGFDLDGDLDWREHAGLRLQAALNDDAGLRRVLAPTSQYRAYYDAIPADPFEPNPMLDAENERLACARARVARVEATGAPWGDAVPRALAATAALRDTVQPFLTTYATDVEADDLPSIWRL